MYIRFGQWLKQLRTVRDLTQEELAQRVGYATASIRVVESGIRRPSRRLAEQLAEVLRVPTEQRDTFIQLARARAGEAVAADEPRSPVSGIQSPGTTLLPELRDNSLPPPPSRLLALGRYALQQLAEEERALIQELAVFRGGFTKVAAHAVVETPLSRLDALLQKAVLCNVAPGRYDILGPLQASAVALLDTNAETAFALRKRHARYFSAWLSQHEPMIVESVATGTLRPELKIEWENVQAAWQWSMTQYMPSSLRQLLLYPELLSVRC